MRWTIEDQIKGDAKLNYDPAKGDVKSPLAPWGPYLWTNGTKGREGDDVVFKAEDLGGDGTHPSRWANRRWPRCCSNSSRPSRRPRGGL